MARRLNWARTRLEKIIAERGSESAYHDLPTPRSLRKKAKRTNAPGAPRARRGKNDSPKHDLLLAEFRRLPRSERVKQAGTFHSRLEKVVASPDERKRIWQNIFAPLLDERESPPATSRLLPKPRRTPVAKPTRSLRQAAGKVRRGRKAQPSSTQGSAAANPNTAPRVSPPQRKSAQSSPTTAVTLTVASAADGISVTWNRIEQASRVKLHVQDASGGIRRAGFDGAKTEALIGKLRHLPQPLTVRITASDRFGRRVAEGSTSIRLKD